MKARNPAAIFAASCFTIFGLGVAPSLFAHGGRYGGPNDTVPPNMGGGDPTGGGTNGGPTTPGPHAPTTGGSGNGGPTTGGAKPPTATGTPTGRGPGASTRRHNGGSAGEEQWEFWWEANDDAFLNLAQRLRQQGEPITMAGGLTSRVARAPLAHASRIDSADLSRIRAALVRALDSADGDVVDSAVLALARCTPAEQGAEFLPAITKTLAHPEKSARESATLALGVLGAPEAVGTLRDLLLDTPAGRQATGRGAHVEEFVRAFAAASLGMIGRPEQFADLKAVVVDESLRASDDVRSLAILALGMLKGAQAQTVPLLQQLAGDSSLSARVRAQAPIALAHVAEQPGGAEAARAALSGLVGRLLDDKTDNDLSRSLAVAIGRIATMDDAEAIGALADAASRASDESTRHFATIALADVAAADPQPERHADAQRKLAALFRTDVEHRKPITQRPYGALALALQARNPNLDRKLHDEAIETLRAAFGQENNPSYKAADAIALGLLGAREADEELSAAWIDSRDPPFRGYVAVSFGLMLARSRADDLRDALVKKGSDPRLKLQIARGLGLLGDPRAVPVLIDSLAKDESTAEVASDAQALGLIGDRTAVAPLLALLDDREQSAPRRGFAAVALGLLGEKGDLPWNAVFTVASNYRAKTPALAEIFDIL